MEGNAAPREGIPRSASSGTQCTRSGSPKCESAPEIAVLRADVTEAEYWQASSSSLVRSAKYLAAAITGGKTTVGEAGHVLV